MPAPPSNKHLRFHENEHIEVEEPFSMRYENDSRHINKQQHRKTHRRKRNTRAFNDPNVIFEQEGFEHNLSQEFNKLYNNITTVNYSGPSSDYRMLHPKLRIFSNLARNSRYMSSPAIPPLDVVPPRLYSELCSSVLTLPGGLNANYDLGDLQYPNNLLRNVALQAARTTYSLVLDVDMVASSGLHDRFLALSRRLYQNSLSNNHSQLKIKQFDDAINYTTSRLDNTAGLKLHFGVNEKIAFVLPAYEVQDGTKLPDTKSEMLTLVAQGKARPFYSELCEKCQVGNYNNNNNIP